MSRWGADERRSRQGMLCLSNRWHFSMLKLHSIDLCVAVGVNHWAMYSYVHMCWPGSWLMLGHNCTFAGSNEDTLLTAWRKLLSKQDVLGMCMYVCMLVQQLLGTILTSPRSWRQNNAFVMQSLWCCPWPKCRMQEGWGAWDCRCKWQSDFAVSGPNTLPFYWEMLLNFRVQFLGLSPGQMGQQRKQLGQPQKVFKD